VARVVDLEDEVERLRLQSRAAGALQTSQEKVAHLPVGKTHTEVIAALERVGVKLSPNCVKRLVSTPQKLLLKPLKL